MQQHTIKPIALIGLSGAGKSSVGRALAARLGWQLIDTDALIEQLAGRSIPSIFADQGESYFRDLETTALQKALSSAPCVIPTGGGIVVRESNRQLLKTQSYVAWLDASTDVLIARLRAHDEQRPLLAGDDPAARLEALRTARAALYAELGHIRVDTAGLSTAAVCDTILARYEHHS